MKAMRLLSILGLAGVAATASAQSVMNPSYESGPASTGWTRVNLGSQAIEGWTVDQGNIDHIGTMWRAAEGNRSIELNGNAPGRIHQVLQTNPGSQYIVEFALSGNWGGHWNKKVRVTAGDESELFFYDSTGNRSFNMNWEDRQFVFTADSATTTLRFASNNYGKHGGAVDNIRVSEIIVPAPAAGLALLGLAGMGRRRR